MHPNIEYCIFSVYEVEIQKLKKIVTNTFYFFLWKVVNQKVLGLQGRKKSLVSALVGLLILMKLFSGAFSLCPAPS